MRPRTRLLLFVLVPLAVAVGGVAWGLQRRVVSIAPARRPLPATTQYATSATALAWRQVDVTRWSSFGLIEPGRWFGTPISQHIGVPDLEAGDSKSGRVSVATSVRSHITGPAVAARGVLFAPTGNADVAAIDLATLRAVWTAKVGTGEVRVAVDGGRVVACAGEHVACFDPDSGRMLWSVKSTSRVTAGPGLGGEYACYATADAQHVLDAATGRVLHLVPATDFSNTIIVDGERAFALGAGASGPREIAVTAIDLAHGVVAWRWSETTSGAAGFARLMNGVHGPAVGDGVVTFAVEDRLYALDAATGRLRWSWQAERDDGSQPQLADRPTAATFWQMVQAPTMHGGVVYAAWHGDRVSAWEAATGREVWRYTPDPFPPRSRDPLRSATPAPRAIVPSDVAPFVGDGLLLAGTSDGLVGIHCDLLPKPASSSVASAGRTLAVSTSVGVASTLLLIAIILGVFGLWRLMIAAACAAFCGLTVWAWACSYAAADFVGYDTTTRTNPFVARSQKGIISHAGSLSFGHFRSASQPIGRQSLPSGGRPEWRWERESGIATPQQARDALSRFAWTHRSRSSGVSLSPQAETSLTLPHWFVAAVMGVAPMAWVTGLWRDRRRHPRGHCRGCGYDLRGITGRCPECGLEIATKRLFGRVRG